MSPLAHPRINVLVVDDDADSNDLVGLLIERRGWSPAFASDLAQARRILDTNDVSALVTDLSLHDGCGFSLLAGGRPPTLRAAVVVSGLGDGEERRKSAYIGFDAFFVKPVDGAELIGVLERLLAPTNATVSGSALDLAQNLLSSSTEDAR